LAIRSTRSRAATRATRATARGRRRCFTEVGEVEVEVPRDREGSFEPKIVRKQQRRMSGVDELVISLATKADERRDRCPPGRRVRGRGLEGHDSRITELFEELRPGSRGRSTRCTRSSSSTRSTSRSATARCQPARAASRCRSANVPAVISTCRGSQPSLTTGEKLRSSDRPVIRPLTCAHSVSG
jgi:Transposase, Mutator family